MVNRNGRCRSALVLGASLVALLGLAPGVVAADAIRYVVRVPQPETHYAEIEATFPTEGREAIDLMMAVWSPGFYRVEDYAALVEGLTARTPDGKALDVDRPAGNRWRIKTAGAATVVVSYRLLCTGRSVTTNTINETLLVINPAAAFMTLAGSYGRPHDLRFVLPARWKPAMSGLNPGADKAPNHFQAPDFDTLVDNPIVAGDISVRDFKVGGSLHELVDAGTFPEWDERRGAEDLAKIVEGTKRYWGGLPFKRYVFLNVFRPGGGGLEHANSTLLTSSPQMRTPTLRWLSFVGHEYFHAINVKRLRPVELGPFDYERPPSTTGLWISEGLTTYGADLVIAHSRLADVDQFLSLLSDNITTLQNTPGRLKQTLEQASLDVWTSGTSGTGRDPENLVSYYVKGPVVGLLLDARIQRVTRGRKSLQDVMRLAYKRYGGSRGFTADQFEAAASEVAGTDLKSSFQQWLRSTDELDYTEALDWFGLRFPKDAKSPKPWLLSVSSDASADQRSHLSKWLQRPVSGKN